MMKGALANTSWVRCATDLPAPALPLLNRGVVRWRGSPVAYFSPSLGFLLAPNLLGSKPSPDQIRVPNFLHRHSVHPDLDQDGSEGASAERQGVASGGGAAPAPFPKGSWEGSWVKERRIELLRQGHVILSEDLVSCRPPGVERVPAPKPREAVVFFEHF
jgi:hypothetical protein